MLLNEKLKVLIEGKFGNLEMHFGKSGRRFLLFAVNRRPICNRTG